MKKINALLTIFIMLFLWTGLAYAEGGGDDGDDDTTSNNPTIAVQSYYSVAEGDSGTKTVTVSISISECPNLYPINLSYTTQDGLATTSDNDYNSKNGSISFGTSCSTTQTVTVTVNGDENIEDDEGFTLNFSDNNTNTEQTYSFSGGTSCNITITNDDEDDTPTADIFIHKSAPSGTYNVGDTLVYTLTVTNYGPEPTTISLSDLIPSNLSYISYSESVDDFDCSVSGQAFQCSGNHIFADGESITIELTTHIDSATNGSTIHNTATVESGDDVVDGDTSNNSSTAYVSINDPDGAASITKTVNNDEPLILEEVTFTIRATNTGSSKRLVVYDHMTRNWHNYVSYNIIHDSQGQATCTVIDDSGYSYINVECDTNVEYNDGDYLEIEIVGTIYTQGGTQCNHAYVKKYGNYSYYAIATACTTTQYNAAPIVIIEDSTLSLGQSYSLSIENHSYDPDNDPMTYDLSGSLPPGFTYDAATTTISGGPVTADLLGQSFILTASATDDPSARNANFDPETTSVQFTLTFSDGTIDAIDDSYDMNTTIGSVSGNFMTNDQGMSLSASTTPTSAPSQGSVIISSNGSFTYTANANFSGSDTFMYTITDQWNNTDTATVTITPSGSGNDDEEQNYMDFYIVNPPESRNIIGNYKIAGNTVLCLTDKEDAYNGTCVQDKTLTNNDRFVKYIDIDSDSETWNSSSSYIQLNAPYKPEKGIEWAGLFWEGRIGTAKDYNISFAERSGSGYKVVKTGKSKPSIEANDIDLLSIGADKLKLKIDSGSYASVKAETFKTHLKNKGKTYAAFADVTDIVKAKKLGKGKHVFTVADLVTMEGRDKDKGGFGGWSLVVIYAENYTDGKARNISIYNGFQTMELAGSDKDITISGFKLPKTGTVDAQLSIFSGDGEFKYGRTPDSPEEDWVKISRTGADGSYEKMPGKTTGSHFGNADNMFDAKMDNILRDNIAGKYNNLSTNNNGVDIDNYDVSDILEGYRNQDENINSIHIKALSTDDYVTLNMISFSAELYVPKLCYDYTLDIDKHVLDSVNNEIKTSFGGYGKPLTTVLYLKSEEGDIPLSNMNAKFEILKSNEVAYKNCTTEISETGEYDYSNACTYTHDTAASGFEMYIGDGKSASHGGVINALEQRYIRFKSEFKKPTVNTEFEFSVDYTVDYGSGSVPLRKTFTRDDLCPPINNGYYPELGMFNVTDGGNRHDEWNLYTQVSGRPFSLKLYAHKASDPKKKISTKLNLPVEVEMVRADEYEDSVTMCNDEHALLEDVPAKFVKFNNTTNGVNFSYEPNEINFAYRSLAMRIWYLTDIKGNGTLVNNHNCTRKNQKECIELYKREYGSKKECSSECRTGSSSGCYDCLRSNYGRKVCSRDNFTLRPEAFSTEISDNNQKNTSTAPRNIIANSVGKIKPFSLVAGYKYRFDVNATSNIDNNAVPRYIQDFSKDSLNRYASMMWNPKNGANMSNCVSTDDKNIDINLFYGNTVNTRTREVFSSKIDEIGKYKLEVFDQSWTSVDWGRDAMNRHSEGIYKKYFKKGYDCLKNQDVVPLPGAKPKNSPDNNDPAASDSPRGSDNQEEIESIKRDLELLYKILEEQIRTGDKRGAEETQKKIDELEELLKKLEEDDDDNDDTGSAGGSVGCVISSTHKNLTTGDTFQSLPTQYYPYTFDLRGLNIGAGPDSSTAPNATVYINTVIPDFYPNGQNEHMSYSARGVFGAVGMDGRATRNFVDKCYAENVDMSLIQNYTNKDEMPLKGANPDQSAFLRYDLVNYSNESSTVLNTDNQLFVAQDGPLKITQASTNFLKPMQGSLHTDVDYNFDRNINIPLNPRNIFMERYEVSYSTPPPSVHVNMKSNYIIKGTKQLGAANAKGQNVTFAYARVKSSKPFYDDIIGNSVLTPISTVVYCDLGFALCNGRGIDVNNGQTDEPYWWRATTFNNTGMNRDGNVVLSATQAALQDDNGVNDAKILNIGIQNGNSVSNFNVAYVGDARPYTENILFNTFADDADHFTDRWLIYNQDGAMAPNPFYRVRFINNATWAGHGDTGNVVNTSINRKKNKRVGW